MYRIHKSIDIDFGHHVHGHPGACINLHGHTWKFEVELEATTLDANGFVVDFKLLKQSVLEPVHKLLDHSMALSIDTYSKIEDQLDKVGEVLLATRREPCPQTPGLDGVLSGAFNQYPGGMKIALFPFSPTSERLAEWLYKVADASLGHRVRVVGARVYETLHPVESVATYLPNSST